MEYRLTEPFTKDKLKDYRAGDRVLITGTVYTARDAAHKRITEMLMRGEKPPFEIENSIVYYVGPTPAKPGMAIGSAGPTTSYRMDAYAPKLLDLGDWLMIGKGQRSDEVRECCGQERSCILCGHRRRGGTDGKTDKERGGDSL